MATQQLTQAGAQFLIFPLRCECDENKFCELCQAIERYGGRKTNGGYAFDSAKDRAVALDLLGERFGSRYFRLDQS